MKAIIALVVFVGAMSQSMCSSAQFLYKDLYSIRQAQEQIRAYKAGKVRKVILRSFDGRDEALPGFVCFQEINAGFNIVKTFTQTAQTLQSVLTTQYNARGQLIRSADSSNSTLHVTTYSYDAAGQLATVDVLAQAYAYKTRETEKHVWIFANGLPERMWQIKGNGDSTEVKFVIDEQGRVGEELWYKRGKLQQQYYYYYNEQGFLTDLVRFNEKAKRLLPDYVFEYNGNGQLQQLIAVPPGSNNYLTWKYTYDERGLKVQERCYNKQKDLVGYITYEYQ